MKNMDLRPDNKPDNLKQFIKDIGFDKYENNIYSKLLIHQLFILF